VAGERRSPFDMRWEFFVVYAMQVRDLRGDAWLPVA